MAYPNSRGEVENGMIESSYIQDQREREVNIDNAEINRSMRDVLFDPITEEMKDLIGEEKWLELAKRITKI